MRQVVVIVTLAITIFVNALANSLPLNGQTTGSISDRFPIFFVPAGYVFSIWGLIYLGLVGFAVYQALPAQRENPRLRRTGYLFALSNLLNAVWVVLWHYNVFGLAIVVIVAVLLTLIAIYLRLDIGRYRASPAETWLAQVPFSIYLGWASVATIANTSQLLYWLGWQGAPLSGQAWAAIMLVVASALGALVAWTRRDVAYLAVFVWAFVGIAVKHAAEPLVAGFAWAAAATAASLAVASLASRIGARRSVSA